MWNSGTSFRSPAPETTTWSPGSRTVQHLDLAHGGGAELDRRQDGAVAVHDVDGARAGGDVRAPLELRALSLLR